jgi:hypothetical protein
MLTQYALCVKLVCTWCLTILQGKGMARIPEEQIERGKRETDLVALVRSRGIELVKHGAKDFAGRCPFHEEQQASFITQ